MTPYEIGVMLWYYARCNDHPDIEHNPPVWRPTIDQFLAQDLLAIRDRTIPEESRGPESCYVITDRGTAYVERLQTIGLPTQSWGYDR